MNCTRDNSRGDARDGVSRANATYECETPTRVCLSSDGKALRDVKSIASEKGMAAALHPGSHVKVNEMGVSSAYVKFSVRGDLE